MEEINSSEDPFGFEISFQQHLVFNEHNYCSSDIFRTIEKDVLLEEAISSEEQINEAVECSDSVPAVLGETPPENNSRNDEREVLLEDTINEATESNNSGSGETPSENPTRTIEKDVLPEEAINSEQQKNEATESNNFGSGETPSENLTRTIEKDVLPEETINSEQRINEITESNNTVPAVLSAKPPENLLQGLHFLVIPGPENLFMLGVVSCELCDGKFIRAKDSVSESNICYKCKSEFFVISDLMNVCDTYVKASVDLEEIAPKVEIPQVEVEEPVEEPAPVENEKENIEPIENQQNPEVDGFDNTEIFGEPCNDDDMEDRVEGLSCKKCDRKFSREASLALHETSCLQMHNLKCTKCGLEYTNKTNFNNHIKKHKSCICNYCGLEVEQAADRAAHELTHKDATYECRTCGLIFAKERLLELHVYSHSIVVECVVCKLPFKQSLLLDHQREIHVPSSNYKMCEKGYLNYSSGNCIAKCKFCKKMFTRDYIHVYHMQCHNYRCFFCLKPYLDWIALAHHQTTHPEFHKELKGVYKCDKCGLLFKREIGLRNHLFVHGSPDIPEGIRVYHCDCGMFYSVKDNFVKHKQIAHDLTATQEEAMASSRFMCNICGLTFTTVDLFKEHALLHKLGFKFKCKLCGRKFGMKTHFESHLCNCHRKEYAQWKDSFLVQGEGGCVETFGEHYIDDLPEKTPGNTGASSSEIKKEKAVSGTTTGENQPIENNNKVNNEKPPKKSNAGFKCDICLKVYKGTRRFKRHMINAHNVQSEYYCDVCAKSFVGEDLLYKHVENHSVYKKCVRCEENIFRGDFKKHKEQHEREESNYICKICDRLFLKEQHLNNHLVVHKSKTNLCEECGAAFGSLQYLHIHTKVAHGEIQSCKVCEEVFPNAKVLKKHIMIQHQQIEIYSYICDQCGSGFEDQDQLNDHIQVCSTKHHCNLCLRDFSVKENYEKHLRDHEKKVMRHCTTCDVWYSRGFILTHMKKHKKVTIYRCAVCQNKFLDKETCMHHASYHPNKERNYYCPVCKTKAYTNTWSLKFHMMSVHNWSLEFYKQALKNRFWEPGTAEHYSIHYEKEGDEEPYTVDKRKTKSGNIFKMFDFPPECEVTITWLNPDGQEVAKEINGVVVETTQIEEGPLAICETSIPPEKFEMEEHIYKVQPEELDFFTELLEPKPKKRKLIEFFEEPLENKIIVKTVKKKPNTPKKPDLSMPSILF